MPPAPQDVAPAEAGSGTKPATNPIDSPTCQPSPTALGTQYGTGSGSSISPQALLRLLRNSICNDALCEAPAGIDPTAVVVIKDEVSVYKTCEVSVGLGGGLEGYVYRQTEPVGVLRDECSTSIDNMIDSIGALTKQCWWVGPEPNQVYQAGFRQLNSDMPVNSSLHIVNGVKIANVLPDTSPDVATTERKSTGQPKVTIPAAIAGAVSCIILIFSLIVFLIWRRNKREQRRYAAALERRAQRKAKKEKASANASVTWMGSERSWDASVHGTNVTAPLTATETELRQMPIRSPSPVAVRSPSPVAVRSPSPVAVRSPSPAALRSTSPAAIRSPSPAVARGFPLPEEGAHTFEPGPEIHAERGFPLPEYGAHTFRPESPGRDTRSPTIIGSPTPDQQPGGHDMEVQEMISRYGGGTMDHDDEDDDDYTGWEDVMEMVEPPER